MQRGLGAEGALTCQEKKQKQQQLKLEARGRTATELTVSDNFFLKKNPCALGT